MANNPNPPPNLSANQPIAQPGGFPSAYFQRIWQQWTTYIETAIVALLPAGANPSATAGPSAVNGVATTFMRSDAAPAVQVATTAQKGIVEPDGTTITITGGVISATASGIDQLTGDVTAGPGTGSQAATLATVNADVGSYTLASVTVNAKGLVTAASSGSVSVPTGANPSATISGSAVNGSATTFMRSDAAPALANTAVTAGSYTLADITVDAQGRITAASTVTALPNGTTATTQSAGDSTTKVATTAFVQAALPAWLPLANSTLIVSTQTYAVPTSAFGPLVLREYLGTMTDTLPAAGSLADKNVYYVRAVDGAVVVTAGSGTTIHAAASFTVPQSRQAYFEYSTASTNWVFMFISGDTGVTAGSYTAASLTVDEFGYVTAASSNTIPASANPSATAGPSAINGSAATFMRSDAAPAVQKASSSQFGIVEVDNTTIKAASGVISVGSLLGNAVNNIPVNNPTGTTSASKVMMGCGQTFTPARSGNLFLLFSTRMFSSVAGDELIVMMNYGTGTPPANGAAITGTQAGPSMSAIAVTIAGTGAPQDMVPAILTGLSVGTTYWFDAAVERSSGSGTVGISQPNFTIIEM